MAVHGCNRIRLAGVLARIDRLYAHFAHVVPNSLVVNKDVIFIVKPPADPPVSEFRVSGIYFINMQFDD